MPKKSFHIQHNTNLRAVDMALMYSARGQKIEVFDFADSLGIAESVAEKLILPFLRQSGVLNREKEQTIFGRRLGLLRDERPELLGEALHTQLYTLHWRQTGAYFSFAYAALCQWLCARGAYTLDGDGQGVLVEVALDAAARAYGLDPGGIAFSKSSVQGAMRWLEATDPPALVEQAFARRAVVPLHTVLWIVGRLYARRGVPVGTRLTLDEETAREISDAALLDPANLDRALAAAQSAYDFRRGGGFFGVGTEGGFGRYLLLTRPFPVAALEPGEEEADVPTSEEAPDNDEDHSAEGEAN